MIGEISAMATPQQQHHVLAVPFPSQGHLTPLMRFCKLLAKEDGFIVTFVDFDVLRKRHQSPSTAAPAGSPPSLIRRALLCVQGLDLAAASFQHFYDALTSIVPHLEDLIFSLNRDGPPVTCLLSDLNMTLTTQDIADKFGIPRIVLYPCAASRLLFTHYLVHRELISLEEVEKALSTCHRRGDVFCKLPGLPTLLYSDIPHFRHVTDETVALWRMTMKSWQVSDARAHAVVANTFEELEASSLATLSKCCRVPIYDVGFWTESVEEEIHISMWQEDDACTSWLDQQAGQSILYISFGSISRLSQAQYEELLNGLLSSQQCFLWVLRPGLVENLDRTFVVTDIMSKSQGRGLVVDWAPQLAVLAHPAVGGFLTHCGWNSVSESIAHGVPMICWPYFGDQLINARSVADELKVGLHIETGKENSGRVNRNEIEKVIRALMEGTEGRFVRENAVKLKEKSGRCFLQNGSSSRKLNAVIESLANLKSTRDLRR